MKWLENNWFWLIGVLGLGLMLKSDSNSQPKLGEIESARSRVVNASLSRVGSSNSLEFWSDVLPGQLSFPKDWCGAYALWVLHQAGLAIDWSWIVGKGFLFRLPQTKNPQFGDMAYFDKNQHHAVVSSINSNGTVSLVNGNGLGGKVTISTIPIGKVTAFFSIQPLTLT